MQVRYLLMQGALDDPNDGCEVAAVFKDSFSEGGVYPLRALVAVMAVATVLLALIR